MQAVRLLQHAAGKTSAVGRAGSPRREAVRFRAMLSLAFPPSEVPSLERPDDPSNPAVMTVAFFGLTGPSGVMPYAYTELMIERARAGDRTLSAFLDLFNHRLISLFYRAWEKSRPYLAHEMGGDDPTSRHLFSLIGLGLEPLRNRSAFPDEAMRFYAGLFARRHRPAIGLTRLLNDYFGLPVEIHQFVGQWLPMFPEDRSRLGASGAHNALGVSLVLGARVWDEQGKFRVVIGPLSLPQFLAFLPDGPDFKALSQMVRMYVDAEYGFDIQLLLKADDVPACHLSANAATPPQLGRTAWLKSQPFANDADDAVFPTDG